MITAPHHWGGSRSLEGQPECPGHTAGRRGKAFSRPGLSFPAFLVLEMLSTGTRLTWKQGRFKNKTRAGCASLLAHFAAFQLKGESQAWLFITNPDLACSSWGGAVVVHRPQRNPSEDPPGTPPNHSPRPSGRVGVSGMGAWGSEKSWPEGGALGQWGGRWESQLDGHHHLGLTRVAGEFQVLGALEARG